jgi:hypothetical protein
MPAVIHLSEAEAEKLGLIQKSKSIKEHRKLKKNQKIKEKFPSLWDRILDIILYRFSAIDSVEYEFDDLEGEL